jgi:flagellar basal body rod protein FlgC
MKSKLLLLFIIFYLLACEENVNEYIYILSNHVGKDFITQYLTSKNISIVEEESLLKIERNNKNLKILIEYLNLLEIKIDVIINNIENVNTTRTSDDSYFKRKYLIITEEGKINILDDNKSQPRLKYDPSHPDAIKSGVKKGYVEYPNINLYREYYEYIWYVNQYNSIIDMLKSNDINIIFTKINPNEYILYKLLTSTNKINESIIEYLLKNIRSEYSKNVFNNRLIK